MDSDLLSVRDLSICLQESGRFVIEGVSLDIPRGTVTGIVGGSGSGKTTLGLSLLGLIPLAMRVSSGEIIFEGRAVLAMPAREQRMMRGRRIGMIFQEPASAFDPVFTIGGQIAETLEVHEVLSSRAREARVLEALERAGVPDPVRVARSYPHELSGGLRQRAMIAQAIVCRPSLLVADEPTSSLDVTLQAQIMALLRELKSELGLSVVLISHDLGMVSRLADEIVIMSEGRIVEAGPAERIMKEPRQEYARKLVEAGGL